MQSKSGEGTRIRLETLELSHVRQGWDTAKAKRSCDGNTIKIAGQEFAHGVGTHSHSEILVRLNGAATRFTAMCGVDDEVKGGSVVFEAWVDGKPAARTKLLRGGDAAERLEVDLTNARELFLIVQDGGDGMHLDHADWADAVIEMATGETRKPETFPLPGMDDAPIAPFDVHELRINGPRVVGCTPGRDFLFGIPATGPASLEFSATDLPDGLAIDPRAGTIWGAVKDAGEYNATLTVRAEGRSVSRDLRIVAGQEKLALTPPMGWNSWNCWGTAIDGEKVRSAADWMVQSGLSRVGYMYINIDDCWQGERDIAGRIQPNERFGDMRTLADYVHRLGLRIGTYSSPGVKTCAGYAGSFDHETLDAQRYAEWKMDYMKYDLCSYLQKMKDQSEEEQIKPYRVMGDALAKVDRDIVFSLCQATFGDAWEWGPGVHGNLWRTTEDIVDTWGSVIGIAMRQNVLAKFAGPGRWNDPDMLVVGKLGWGANVKDTRLSKTEQVTHMTLWALFAAPLLIGCDMAQLDEFTLAVLGNPEVIDVNQDALGKQADLVRSADAHDLWVRELQDGARAVGLVNRSPVYAEIAFRGEEIGVVGRVNVRDAWRRSNAGAMEAGGEFTVKLPPHGSALLVVRG